MKRWKCPRCDAGALAPSRPRKDDVRRYCLECSKKTGRLVLRICPVLEKQRGAVAAKRKAKQDKKRAAAAADPKVKLEKIFRQYKKLKCWKDDVKHATITITIAQSKTKSYSTGSARYRDGYVRMTMGTDWYVACATVLHELVHVCQGKRDGRWNRTRHHGDDFRAIYREAIDELVGGYYEPPSKRPMWYMDNALAAALRRMDEAQ
jgi:hypothetical protein